MLRLAAVAVMVLALLPAVGAQATQEPCEQAPTPTLFLEWDSSLENLAFDGHGHLYLSDSGRDAIYRVFPDGRSELALDRGGNGIVWGPDDRLYVAAPSGEAFDILRSTDANATSFEVYSAGVPAYNGMAFDSAWNLYVSDDNLQPPATPPDLVRVPRDDPMAWEEWTDITGPDGIAYDPVNDVLYTDLVKDQSSPILRFSPTDRARLEVVAYLSFGVATLEPAVHEPQGEPTYPVPKGPDDLMLAPDGSLYIAGHVSGELIRLDPATGSACIVGSGLEEPSSVRLARGFGDHGGQVFVSTWGGTGIVGLAQTTAGSPPSGKVWSFDVGFREDPVTGNVSAPPTTGPDPVFDDNDVSDPEDEEKKGSPGAAPLAFLLSVVVAALLARRRR